MDINTNQERWIEATEHQAFTDIVTHIVETLTRSLYDQLVKVVGFDNLIVNNDDEIATVNALNELIAKVLFESITPKQLTELVNSHNTDK